MLNNLMEIKNATSWEELCHKLGIYLGLGEPAPVAVVRRVVQDHNFARYLVSSRNRSDMLEVLLNDSHNKDFEKTKEAECTSGSEIFLQTAISVYKWCKIGYIDPEMREYSRRYETYLKSEKLKNPEATPCKCTDIKVDEFREVYLDHNATTYIRQEVITILNDYYNGKYGYANPSSNTMQGNEAYELVSGARKKIAQCLSVQEEEIYFTGCGSESNNLAIKGIAYNYLNRKGHIITSKVEHMSVLRVMEHLEYLGFVITYIDVDRDGRVSPLDIKNAIREDTILVSIMAVNNEIGTINPIGEIGSICKEHNIPFMVDAVQACGKIPLNPKEMKVSLLTFSGHKIYAPKGIGGIYVDKGLELVPLIHGGEQEFGMRSGTENVGSILAMAEAIHLACAEMEQETLRLLELRGYFLDELKKIEPNSIVNGPLDQRIPNNLSVGFPNIDSGALLKSLNKFGISVSAGSACSSKKINTSHVLTAIGVDTQNYATIRFSFGLKTQKDDLSYLFHYLDKILSKLREG